MYPAMRSVPPIPLMSDSFNSRCFRAAHGARYVRCLNPRAWTSLRKVPLSTQRENGPPLTISGSAEGTLAPRACLLPAMAAALDALNPEHIRYLAQALRREGAALSPLFFLELDHGTVVAPVIVFARHGLEVGGQNVWGNHKDGYLALFPDPGGVLTAHCSEVPPDEWEVDWSSFSAYDSSFPAYESAQALPLGFQRISFAIVALSRQKSTESDLLRPYIFGLRYGRPLDPESDLLTLGLKTITLHGVKKRPNGVPLLALNPPTASAPDFGRGIAPAAVTGIAPAGVMEPLPAGHHAPLNLAPSPLAAPPRPLPPPHLFLVLPPDQPPTEAPAPSVATTGRPDLSGDGSVRAIAGSARTDSGDTSVRGGAERAAGVTPSDSASGRGVGDGLEGAAMALSVPVGAWAGPETGESSGASNPLLEELMGHMEWAETLRSTSTGHSWTPSVDLGWAGDVDMDEWNEEEWLALGSPPSAFAVPSTPSTPSGTLRVPRRLRELPPQVAEQRRRAAEAAQAKLDEAMAALSLGRRGAGEAAALAEVEAEVEAGAPGHDAAPLTEEKARALLSAARRVRACLVEASRASFGFPAPPGFADGPPADLMARVRAALAWAARAAKEALRALGREPAARAAVPASVPAPVSSAPAQQAESREPGMAETATAGAIAAGNPFAGPHKVATPTADVNKAGPVMRTGVAPAGSAEGGRAAGPAVGPRLPRMRLGGGPAPVSRR